jgi:hypothetical protein
MNKKGMPEDKARLSTNCGGVMKCPNCYFDNQKNINVCENCGEDLYPPSQPENNITPNTGYRRKRGFGFFIGKLFSGIFSFLGYIIVLLLITIAILAVLIFQCRLNIPLPPAWDFLPKVVISYWNWADDWQMEQCPDLNKNNYFFGSEPLPKFDNEGNLVIEPECGQAAITFSPWSAPAGSIFEISLDSFSPNDTVHACWYYPSTALVNCTDLETDNEGHRDTKYWSSSTDPTGTYRMEAQGQCSSASVEWTVE